MQEFLTTKELADLLRLKERKVYDLAASGSVPCVKATGKLLFPRAAIDRWLADSQSGFSTPGSRPRPTHFLGSHDPLLDWALRESGCGIATLFGGSADGLTRFAQGDGIASGLHLYDAEGDTWNVPFVERECRGLPAVLLQWAVRRRGLILADSLEGQVRGLADLGGRRFVPRQAQAGAQQLFLDLARREGLDLSRLELTPPALSESDAALSVREGKGEATFGLAACAQQYGLAFVPIVSERFDLLVDRRAFFEPPLRQFFEFCTSERFRNRARELAGYDLSGFGTVRFNG